MDRSFFVITKVKNREWPPELRVGHALRGHMDLELGFSDNGEGFLPDIPGVPMRLSAAAQPIHDRSSPAFLDLFQRVIDGLPEQIALVDDKWQIITVNEA